MFQSLHEDKILSFKSLHILFSGTKFYQAYMMDASSDFKSVMATSQAFMAIVRMSLLAVMEASYFFHQSIELLPQVFKGKHVE